MSDSETLLFGPDGRPVTFFGFPVVLSAHANQMARVIGLPEPWAVEMREPWQGCWRFFVRCPRPAQQVAVSDPWERFFSLSGSLPYVLWRIERELRNDGMEPMGSPD